VIDLVGSSSTTRLGTDSLIKGGKLIIVGLFGGDITLPTPFFPLRAMTLQGSYVGSLTEMSELLNLVRRKGLPSIPVTTRPRADINAALSVSALAKSSGGSCSTPAG
jgi:alcohol dehydrogenase, propanol-preferring